ncbi:MAG: M56 family metallopeptidase [Calditrichaeota bacterium]|nr:M56 family metallopeptidase [Calditrichota bacterium]MBT7788141.1 M56 family metallopeptidase [Calditrichota bacterium]
MNTIYFLSLADNAGYTLIRFLLSLFWQSSIVLLGALGLMYVLRHYRTSIRHAVLTTIFLSIPLIPILSGFAGYLGIPQASFFVPPEIGYFVFDTNPVKPLNAEVIQTVYNSNITQTQPIPSIFTFPYAILLLIMISGFLSMFFIVATGRRRIGLLLKGSNVVSNVNVVSTFDDAAARLGLRRGYSLVESSQIETPFTSGTRKPVVFLPVGFFDDLCGLEITDIALHELAHIKRYDSLWLTLISICRALLFFNPLAWLAAGLILRLTEQSCDDMVIDATGNPADYARMLTRIAENLSNRRLIMELSAGIVLSRKAFIKRVRNILSAKGKTVRRLTKVHCAALILDVILVFGIAIAAPLNDNTDVKVMQAKVKGEDLQKIGESVEIGMDFQTVTKILGKPEETVDVPPSSIAYVWKEKGFLHTKHTVIVVFENDKIRMISSSSGNVPNIEFHIQQAEESSRLAKKVEMDGKIIPMHEADNMWVNVPHALKKLTESGHEEPVLIGKNVDLFDQIEFRMPFGRVVKLLGVPSKQMLDREKETHIWNFDDAKFTLILKNELTVEKEIKTPNFNLHVEEKAWNIEGQKNSVRVKIED